MTRTQGRRDNEQPNCISLEDLIKPESMLGMYSNTFLLEWDFIAPLLPILSHPHAKRLVPVRLSFLSLYLFFDLGLTRDVWSPDSPRSTDLLRSLSLARMSSSRNRTFEWHSSHRCSMRTCRSDAHEDLPGSAR